MNNIKAFYILGFLMGSVLFSQIAFAWWNATCQVRYPILANVTSAIPLFLNDSAYNYHGNFTNWNIWVENTSSKIFAYYTSSGFGASFCGIATTTTEVAWQNTSNLRTGSNNTWNTSGTTAVWSFDEGTSGVISDGTLNTHDGVEWKTAQRTQGVFGNAGNFTNSSYNVSGNTYWGGMDELTVQAWIRLEDTSGLYSKTLLRLGAGDIEILGLAGGTTIRFVVNSDFATSITATLGGTGGWTLATFIWENINDRGTIYFNETNMTSGAMGSLIPAAGALIIGNEATGTTGWFGKIDELRIYNRTLTGKEISDTFYMGIFGNVSSLGTEELYISPPSIGNFIEPTDPSTYLYRKNYNFSAVANQLDGQQFISYFILQHNGTLNFAVTNITNSSMTCNTVNSTARACWVEIADIPAISIMGYRWYVNNTDNDFVISSMQSFTLNRASPNLNIYIQNSTDNSTAIYSYITTSELRGNESNSGDSDLWYGLYRNNTLITNGTTVANNTINNTAWQAGIHEAIFNTTGGTNYTSGNIRNVFLTINNATLVFNSLFLNDTYININQSVIIRVNASDGATIVFQLNSSSNTTNYTATGVSNYTFTITKSHLGELFANSTIANITIFHAGNNYTSTKNTTILNFAYARTKLTNILDAPDPATNGSGETFTVTAEIHDTENSNLTSGTMLVEFRGTNYTMEYISASDIYQRLISSAVPAETYTYKIFFTNSSYQSQNSNGTIEIKSGVGGESPGGGGGGSSFSIIPATVSEKEIITNKTIFSVSPTSPSNFMIPGKNYKNIFVIENKGDKSLNIDAYFSCAIITTINGTSTDPACNWFSFVNGETLVPRINIDIPPKSKYSVLVYIKIPEGVLEERKEVAIIFNSTENFGRSVNYVLAPTSFLGFGRYFVDFANLKFVEFPTATLGISGIYGSTVLIAATSFISIGAAIWYSKATIFKKTR